MVFQLIHCLHIFDFKFSTFPQGSENRGCGNVENFLQKNFFHRTKKISTAISTRAVENNSFALNNKVAFPHFHRPYYYY